MDIILNEVELAKDIIKRAEGEANPSLVGKKPSYTLSLLARYMKQVEKKKDEVIFEYLDSFMSKHANGYNSVLWGNKIQSCIKRAKKNKLNQIDYIGITQKELDIIAKLKDEKQERLAFTMLCYAKYYNAINEMNNNWINVSLTDLFKSARVYSEKGISNRLMINDIKDKIDVQFIDEKTKKVKNKKWMELALLVSSTNIKLNFIDNESDKYTIKITDFRELGYEYLLYKGFNYKRCKTCGILFKKTGNKSMYCSTCRKESELLSKRKWKNKKVEK